MKFELGELLICPGGKRCKCLDGACPRVSPRKARRMKKQWKNLKKRAEIVYDPFVEQHWSNGIAHGNGD